MKDTAVPNEIVACDVTFCRTATQVSVNDKSITISPRVFLVLHYLLANCDRVCTREEMMTDVWQITTKMKTRRVDVHVSQARIALERIKSRFTIVSVRGEGYQAQPAKVAETIQTA